MEKHVARYIQCLIIPMGEGLWEDAGMGMQ